MSDSTVLELAFEIRVAVLAVAGMGLGGFIAWLIYRTERETK